MPSAVMTKQEVLNWNNRVIDRFENSVAIKAGTVGENVPGSRKITKSYARAFEKEARDIFVELHLCYGIMGAKLIPVAEEAERRLNAIMDNMGKALDELAKDKDVPKFDKQALDLLKDGATALFDVRAETVKYRVAGKEVEPETVSAYVARLLKEEGM